MHACKIVYVWTYAPFKYIYTHKGHDINEIFPYLVYERHITHVDLTTQVLVNLLELLGTTRLREQEECRMRSKWRHRHYDFDIALELVSAIFHSSLYGSRLCCTAPMLISVRGVALNNACKLSSHGWNMRLRTLLPASHLKTHYKELEQAYFALFHLRYITFSSFAVLAILDRKRQQDQKIFYTK